MLGSLESSSRSRTSPPPQKCQPRSQPTEIMAILESWNRGSTRKSILTTYQVCSSVGCGCGTEAGWLHACGLVLQGGGVEPTVLCPVPEGGWVILGMGVATCPVFTCSLLSLEQREMDCGSWKAEVCMSFRTRSSHALRPGEMLSKEKRRLPIFNSHDYVSSGQ